MSMACELGARVGAEKFSLAQAARRDVPPSPSSPPHFARSVISSTYIRPQDILEVTLLTVLLLSRPPCARLSSRRRQKLPPPPTSHLSPSSSPPLFPDPSSSNRYNPWHS